MKKIILINKPRGKTSFWVVKQIKRIFPKEKVGHAGTLDPLAEGLLVVLVGEATKQQGEIMAYEKEYQAEMVLGLESETYDQEGELYFPSSFSILLPRLRGLNKEKIVNLIEREFQGEINQVVPPFSAVKIKGKRLYQWVREGKKRQLTLPSRRVKIEKIKVTAFSPLKERQKGKIGVEKALEIFPRLKLRMTVGKGFYVRSLVHDLGKKLGTGAVLTGLIRERIGPYSLSTALRIEDIQANGDQ